MTQPAPDPKPPAPSRSRKRRALRTLAWSVGGLIVLVLLLAGGAWWWLGSDQSLATALARAARYLPPGQSLQAREVSGSVRAGGRIGWLRWQSETLAIEVQQASVGWTLAPLLRRRLSFGEWRAAQVRVERRGPPDDQPPEPLQQLVLPIEVELPFRVDELRWSGPPPVHASGLAGRYRYAGGRHALEIAGVDLADGHYSGRAELQGAAPMALEAKLDGRVRAPLAEGRSIELLAHATAQGTLATAAARLQVAAQLKPAELPAGVSADDAMSAEVEARIAPWQPQPVVDAWAELHNVDLAPLWPDAPLTRLSGELQAGPEPAAGATAWQLAATLRNALPGPWDQGRLPLESLEARARFDGSSWNVSEATLELGHGRVEAEGRWSPAPAPWQARATVHGVRLGELHTQLAGAPVSGQVTAEQRGETLSFDARLQAEGGAGAKVLQGLHLQRILAQGQWQTQTQALDLRSLNVEAEGAKLEGKLRWRVADQAGDGDLKLAAPGASAQLRGRLAPAQGGGELNAQVDDAAALQAWIEALPGLAGAFGGAGVQGNARLDAQWQGGWQAVQRRLQAIDLPVARSTEPSLQATLNAPRLDLQWPAAQAGAPRPAPLQLRGLRAELAGSLAQATLSLQGEAGSGSAKLKLDARGGGGLDRPGQWRAALASLRLVAQDSTRPGPWTLETSRAVSATLRTGASRLELEASAGAATLRGPVPGTVQVDWQPVRFSQSGAAAARAYRLQSQGRLRGLPMAWVEAFNTSGRLAELGLSGDLVFDGDWDIDAGDALRARARLARQSGDLRVQAGEAALVTRISSHGTGTASERSMNAVGEGPSTPAGLRQAELRLDAEGDSVRAQLAWDSERAGVIAAEASTRVVQRAGGWQWPADAVLAGRVTARLPQLGVWSMLAPPGWRVAGTLEADATLSGNRAAPRWNGTLAADALALRAAVQGLDLRDGRLRATLAGDRVQISEFSLHGGLASGVRIAGQSGNRSTARSEAATDGGSLDASGELRWGDNAVAAGSGIRIDLQARLRALRVLVRSDRQLALSGALQAKLDSGQFTVRGNLKTERAVIILPDESAPGLGSDVVVHSAAKAGEAELEAEREAAGNRARAARAQTAKPPDVQISFDLGDDFAVQGRGLTTRLEGKLDIRSNRLGAPPRITGEVRTVRGQYRAYGQQLDVETGIARFSGPFDNPALDILAIRPNITQRAGVQITGTALAPRVRLYSEPVLSDAEALSWVVLGRASAQGGAESVVLQQAALALLSGLGQRGSGGSLASRFGLDEIGFKGPGGSGDVRGTAITVGKRIAKDFYLTYERSLAGTFGTLYIFYDLTQRLTLRGQAGVNNGVDLIYTVKYD